MANSTVYPYGTGGSLPSSIFLINDLKTGGADKTLAAQQGVVLSDVSNGANTMSLARMAGEKIIRSKEQFLNI